MASFDIDNDDLMVDCMITAVEMRMLGVTMESDQYPKLPNDIVIRTETLQTIRDDECSITMCGNDGPLVTYCKNGHKMHANCLEYLFGSSTTLETMCCPQCRSFDMMIKYAEAMPYDLEDLRQMYSHDSIAMRSIRV